MELRSVSQQGWGDTRTCNKLPAGYQQTTEVAVPLDRGRLGKVDRQVFREPDHDAGSQIVRVPISEAAWSTWRRYCQALGFSMGEGIAGLIGHELGSVVDGESVGSVYGDWASARMAELDARERELDAWAQQLDERAHRQQRQEQARAAGRIGGPSPPMAGRVGRNDPCPCGSGLKHKRCHGAIPDHRGP